MNTANKSAKIIGVLFLAAMAASLLGGGIVNTVISAQDYLTTIYENRMKLLLGIYLELINAIAVVGIGILMFSFLKQYNLK